MLGDLRTHLLADEDIAAALATYNDAPALFTIDPIPEQCEHPAAVLVLIGGLDEFGTGEQQGGVCNIDLRIYDDRLTSSARIRTLAWKIWGRLTRQDFESDTYDIQIVSASPPMAMSDPDGFPGLRLGLAVEYLVKGGITL